MNSNELMSGEVKEVKWYVSCITEIVRVLIHMCCCSLGRAFVVFRGETDGKVGVLDAYCPHMGANLAVGGKVLH